MLEQKYDSFGDLFKQRMDEQFDFKDAVEEWISNSQKLLSIKYSDVNQVIQIIAEEKQLNLKNEGGNII